jgi:DNA replication protein DnaC
MTATDPAVPRRCTCPHFENEHEEGTGPCRAQIALMPGMSQPTSSRCSCPAFTPREEPARRRAAAELRQGERLPEQISARVTAIRDRAAEAGRLVTVEEQQGMDAGRRAREQQQTRAADARRALEILESVPTRFRSAGITHPEVGRWAGQVVAGDTEESLILLGGVGTGKTTEAFAAWSYVVRQAGRPGEWVTVPDLLEGMRPGRPERVDFTTLQRTRCLLLDDLAAERESEWTAEILYRLLDYRYAWQLPTVITSNVPPNEVRAKLGDRIASRLNGMGRTVVLEGGDRRTPRPK